ncbi:376_t:CDS:2 [Entrophospora sp. SA101]|nr:376_t:CDS:2 [Entrophospora sp. SA101]CAJ0828024.1 9991_t:CDS:2 [Entrophospora sp. SA101]
MFMNIKTLEWSKESLDFFQMKSSCLPKICSSSEIYGTIKTIKELEGIPIAGVLGCFMLFNSGKDPVISESGLLTTVGYKFGSQDAIYVLEGSIAVAVKNTGGVYFVTAFSGLFTPYWHDDACCCIVGMIQYTDKCHIA